MNHKENILIFSVYKYNKPECINQLNHINTLKELTELNIPHLELIEQHPGYTILSILITGYEYELQVKQICQQFDVKDYLKSNGNDRSVFICSSFNLSQGDNVGILKCVSKQNAGNVYFYNAFNNMYYVIDSSKF